jgi:hypothetical protein
MKCSEIDKMFPKTDKIFTLFPGRSLSSLYLTTVYATGIMAQQLLDIMP